MNDPHQNRYLKTFNRLENQRLAYINLINSSSPEKLHLSAIPGKWSAAQLLFHLVQIDQMVLASLEKKVAQKKILYQSRIGTTLRSSLLNLLLWLPLKFKAPEILGEMPEQVEVPQVVNDWEASRVRLKAFLQTFPEELENREIFRHPRSGMLTLKQTLTFLYQHAEHHKGQMIRNLT